MMQNSILEYTNTSIINEPEIYLLQINRIKLQDYIQYGLIVPDMYIGDECEKDIQSNNKSILVVSDGYIDALNEHQILIEIILTEDEKLKIFKTETTSYFSFPLPITRIKKVYTQSKEISKWIIKNIKNSEKGFLPERLFDVYKNNKTIIFQKKEYKQIEINQSDYTKQIRYFDKRMGMFSFVKNVNLYYANQENYISNYNENYFGMLSTLFKEKVVDSTFNALDILKENLKFRDLLYSENQIDKDFIQTILEGIEDLEIKTLFGQILIPNNTRKALGLLLEKELYSYYYIGLVYYFRQKDSNRKDSFKQDIDSLIPYKLSEVSLSILGIYLGYANLRAYEYISIDDKNFKNIFGSDFNIKFKLDTKLDYILIETIYNHSFSQQKGYEFEYLEYPPKLKPLKVPTNKNFKDWYNLVQEEYFEVECIKITKHSFEDIVSEKLNKYGDEITLSKHYLITFISKYFKNLLSYTKNGKPTEPYCRVENFKESILQDNSRQNELLEVFTLDKK